MYKDQINKAEKQLILSIPSTIISLPYKQLSYCGKLIHGITFKLHEKDNCNSYSNKDIASMLNINVKAVSKSRKQLVLLGIEKKVGRKYSVAIDFKSSNKGDKRDIYIPYEVYNSNLSAGAKVLWGEYNSFSKGEHDYFAKRDTTCNKIGCSKTSISNWTKDLFNGGFLEDYYVKSGYCSNQKIVVTKKFKGEKQIVDPVVVKQEINPKILSVVPKEINKKVDFDEFDEMYYEDFYPYHELDYQGDFNSYIKRCVTWFESENIDVFYGLHHVKKLIKVSHVDHSNLSQAMIWLQVVIDYYDELEYQEMKNRE